MFFKSFIIFAIALVLVNADIYAYRIALVKNEIPKVKNDKRMGLLEKHLKIYMLNFTIKLLEREKENKRKMKDLKEKAHLEEKHDTLKKIIYNKYLASKMGGSSFNKDFHTLRY